jgi:hypothetical protein
MSWKIAFVICLRTVPLTSAQVNFMYRCDGRGRSENFPGSGIANGTSEAQKIDTATAMYEALYIHPRNVHLQEPPRPLAMNFFPVKLPQ